MNHTDNHQSKGTSRRDFLKAGSAAGLGAALAHLSLYGCASSPQQRGALPITVGIPAGQPVRVGFVGVGNMGSAHVRNLLNIEGVQLTAICDIVEEKVSRIQKRVEDAGHPRPQGYSRGPWDFERMCEQEQLDLVYTATPWEWHTPVCVAAMKSGKHAATEVPAAVTLEECWELVEVAEKCRKHCVMMENCCYDRTEMLILNMVRQGVLGELIHAECGYLHDLRRHKLTDVYEGNWRVVHAIKRDGDLYPTHGIGPVAQCMNVNRGNQFETLVSMSSKSIGLNQYALDQFGPDSPMASQKFALGDVINTLIRTVHGETILVTHDTNLPRPYSRKILIQGAKGIVRKYPEEKIHIQGRSPGHDWEPLDAYREQYDHPIWKALADKSRGFGHGGMDYIEDYRLIQSLREGTPMDMDVYDAAAWSAISALSERSIARRSRSVDFPDFTRGAWKTREPLGIITI